MSRHYELYYSPTRVPLYESTRKDIQNSIVDLENRLLKKKQAELNSIKQSLYKQKLKQYEQQYKFKLSLAEKSHYDMIVNQAILRKQRIIDLESSYQQQENLERIRLLQQQQQRLYILQKQLQIQEAAQAQAQAQYRYQQQKILQEQIAKKQYDRMLMQKYNQELLARNYEKQLRQSHERNFLYNELQNKQKRLYESPIIQYNEVSPNRINQSNKKGNQTLSTKYVRNSGKKQSPLQTAQKNKSYLKSEQNNKLNQQNELRQKFNNSAIKNGYSNSNSPIKRQKISSSKIIKKNKNVSPHKIADLSPYRHKNIESSPLKNSGQSRRNNRSPGAKKSRIINIENIESDAMKRIQNRLKLATVVYKDSKFRNIKHQLDHLYNTFDNECYIRKDVKDKINNNPKILKKHKLVVE